MNTLLGQPDWSHVRIDGAGDPFKADIDAGGLYSESVKLIIAAGCPRHASIYLDRRGEAERNYYFTPNAAAIARAVLKDYGAQSCRRPDGIGGFRRVFPNT